MPFTNVKTMGNEPTTYADWNTYIRDNLAYLKQYADLVTLTGWHAGETWTYASAVTFTVAGDQTTKYFIGTKIKLTQTTVKYFYVISSSYSDPTTTVTVTGGTDFTLVSAAITSPFYSYAAIPVGFPHWFNYLSTVSGSGGTKGTYAETSTCSKFRIVERACHTKADKQITNVGSWSGTVQVARPVATQAAAAIWGNGRITAQAGLAPRAYLNAYDATIFKFASQLGSADIAWGTVVVTDWILIDDIYAV